MRCLTPLPVLALPLLLLPLLLSLLLATPVVAYGDPMIWPLPQHVTYGSTTTQLSFPFSIFSTNSSADLSAVISRYSALVFPHSQRHVLTPSNLTSLTISLLPCAANASQSFDLGTDEFYNLTVPLDGSALLTACTLYGAIHGLETFSQLVAFNFDRGVYEVSSAPWDIRDFPRFPHRGIMLDVARHFHPLPSIRRLVDAMSYAKLNVLHLHLTDTQCFPYHSPSFPLLSAGAYSPVELYSLTDLADLAEYARLRAVRLMIETDMPGHAASWCVGYPELCPSATCQQPLDPSNERTFTVIAALMEELTSAVPYSLFHLGGDEVDAACWSETPHVAEWMQAHNYSIHDAVGYFTQRVHAIAHSLQRTPVSWDEVYDEFTTELDPSTVVHIWRITQLLINATRDGYRSLVSIDIPWSARTGTQRSPASVHSLCSPPLGTCVFAHRCAVRYARDVVVVVAGTSTTASPGRCKSVEKGGDTPP